MFMDEIIIMTAILTFIPITLWGLIDCTANEHEPKEKYKTRCITVVLALCAGIVASLSPSDISSQFKEKRAGCNRPREATVLYPMIKAGMTKEQIRVILGRPDDHTALKSTEDHWNYTVGWSQAFTLEFEGNRLVKKSQVGLDVEQ
jgi:outer membrane protein assembly factor BamE (lipoprotein component of BamABCDE complex)